MQRSIDPSGLLLPPGTRLLHIGPHKTGTTTVQGAFHLARRELAAQRVRYAGRSRQQARAAHAVTGRPWHLTDGKAPPIGSWRGLVREVRGARELRVVISSEFFCDADPDAIRRIVHDLDPARLQVAVTLRPLARIVPSQYQQWVQNGMRKSFDRWLARTFDRPPGARTPLFWWRHRHDRLIARWAEVVGPAAITVVVVDDRDHGMVLRVFEQLVGLRQGTLVPDEDRTNRSLTLPEIEAVRAFNAAYKAEGLPMSLHSRVMRLGAAQLMKLREPAPQEPRLEMPQWALDRVAAIAREMVDSIGSSGVRVIGDLESLTVVPPSRLEGDRQPEESIPPRVAASMGMGILVAGGLARSRGPSEWVEPAELRRTSTYYLVGTLALRLAGWLADRWREVLARLRAGRGGVRAAP
jgi:hypothetical protein